MMSEGKPQVNVNTLPVCDLTGHSPPHENWVPRVLTSHHFKSKRCGETGIITVCWSVKRLQRTSKAFLWSEVTSGRFYSRCLQHYTWGLPLPPNLTQLTKILSSPISSEMKNTQFFPLQINPWDLQHNRDCGEILEMVGNKGKQDV